MDNKIIKGVSDYYTEKISRFGATASGVDWNSKESQYLRFEQLSRVINTASSFTVLDYGCGYAELINYLVQIAHGIPFSYTGFDVSEKMIQQAQLLFGKQNFVKFCDTLPENKTDYVIASGIFNVKVNNVGDKEWFEYILQTLHSMNQLSEKGFSFNALTKYSESEYMKEYLFYADPLVLFDYCKQHFSRNVALLHDYNLFEFTIIVRK